MNGLNLLSRKNILLWIMFFYGQFSFAQNIIIDHFAENKVKLSKVSITSNLFKTKGKNDHYFRTKYNLNRGDLLTINPKILNDIHQKKSDYLKLKIPYGNDSLELQLYKSELFIPDFNVRTSEDATAPLPINIPVTYRGTLVTDLSSVATLSFTEKNLTAIISTSTGNINVSPLSNNISEYLIYNDQDYSRPPAFACYSDEVNELSHLQKLFSEMDLSTSLHLRSENCVRIYFELDYNLVRNKNGVQNAVNWLAGVFNQVQAIYARDGITIAISEIFAWTSQDQYSGTSQEIIEKFRKNRTQYNGDVAHLLALGDNKLSGIAYVDQLCQPNKSAYAFSKIEGSYNLFPNYSWTVAVIAHETGHVLGSPHTHSCFWPGGPIDGCGPTANPDLTEGDCSPGPIPSNGGTIMSYCHLLDVGVNLFKGFGPLPAQLIKNRISGASCLSTSCIVEVITPFNVKASDSQFVERVTISWTGGEGNYYKVYRNTTNNNAAALEISKWIPGTTFDDLTAVNGKIYYYWIKAAANNSGLYGSEFSIPDKGSKAPVLVNIPANVYATDSIYASRVKVSWSGSPFNYYRVFRNKANNSSSATPISKWISDSNFDDLNAAQNTVYYYWVKASSNEAGANVSAFSAPDQGSKAKIVVTVPLNVDASDSLYTTKVLVTWTGGDGNFFRVYRNTEDNAATAKQLGSWTTDTFYEDKTGEIGKLYYYWVKAASSSNGLKSSDFSQPDAGAKAPVIVTIPPLIDASDDLYYDKVIITWPGREGNYYRVYRNLDPSSSSSVALGGFKQDTMYEDKSAVAGNKYYYWVRAAASSSGSMISDYSAYDIGSRAKLPVVKPTDISATDGIYSDKVRITWTGNQGNFFRVYRNKSDNAATAAALGSWKTDLMYDDKTAVVGTTYFYWVKAAANNKGDDASEFGGPNTGYKKSSCGVPDGLKTSQITSSSVVLSWNSVAGALEYNVYQLGVEFWHYLGSLKQTSVKITGIPSRSFNCFAISATCSSSVSNLSDGICIITTAPTQQEMSNLIAGDLENTIEGIYSRTDEVTIFPNPVLAAETLNINYISESDSKVEIVIYNLAGMKVSGQGINVYKGINRITLSAPHTSGLYGVRMIDNMGKISNYRVLVK